MLSVYDYEDSYLNAKHFAINILVVTVTVTLSFKILVPKLKCFLQIDHSI